jgi:bile acid:Na+ symporter, BASS family
MLKDVILFAVIFGSAGTAILFPGLGSPFQPYLLYFMMILLFLSFLKIDFHALLDTSWRSVLHLGILTTVKLIILPAVLYWCAFWVDPEYAVPVLLLSGISTGVVAPFIANILAADVASVVRMVVVTSFLVPVSLPYLVKLLAGADISVPVDLMIRMLSLVIFVPMGAVVVMKRFAPGVLTRINASQFPISLVLFGLINLGVFSKYSHFLFDHPAQIGVALVVGYVLSALYYLTGFLVSPSRKPAERLAAGVSLALMNNVLVIVFSSRFFGPLSPTLAAMYMFPFFTMIAPLKLIVSHTSWFSLGKTDTR